MTSILDHPNYRQLRAIVAERTSPILAWVGAGLGAAAGLPTWAELRTSLLRALEQKIEGVADDQSILAGKRKAALQQTDFWVAFEILRDALGSSTFIQTIRHTLQPAATAAIPEPYRLLWAMKVRGILTLNLDRLATRSFSQAYPGTSFDQFTGRAAGKHAHVLKTSSRFVAHLHGEESDATSWVLTKTDLDSLLGAPDYQAFLQVALMGHTVVFLGIGATDRSVRSHLEHLGRIGVDFGRHYWLTDSSDMAIDRLAESIGILRIPYRAHNGSHEPLLVALRDLASFVAPDDSQEPGHPVAALALPPDERPLLPPGDLVVRPVEEIRLALNHEARRILVAGDERAMEEYRTFTRLYDEAIDRAWYTPRQIMGARFLGYVLEEELGHGGFGRIFRARDKDGGVVALKLLHDNVRHQEEVLFAFRRGVRAMEILRSHRLPGVVAYRDASEIPAMVVMDLIEGPNLEQSVLERRLEGWGPRLKVACELAEIIHGAHQLPERVLHRDLRPANVMLSNQYADADDWQTVVLDFDLSWHRGAVGLSLVPSEMSSVTGYLAPEQIVRDKSASTRNAAVDAFGLAMTLFFALARRHPLQLEHRHNSWIQTLRSLAQQHPCGEWRSLPSRFARLLEFCTADNQSARWDVAMARAELMRLRSAYSNPGDVRDLDLLAEELAARSSFGAAYEWDPEHDRAVRRVPGSVEMEIGVDRRRSRICIEIRYSASGTEDRRRWPGSQQRFREGVTADLRRVGVQASCGDEPEVFRARGDFDADTVHKVGLDSLVAGIDAAARRLRL